MGAKSITRAKSIARGHFAENYKLKLVFGHINVMVLTIRSFFVQSAAANNFEK
jgi:hypothetical protein